VSEAKRILGIISDLYFVSRLKEAAAGRGLEVDWLEEAETETEFVKRLEKSEPALIVLDLNTGLPWPHWIPAAKTNFATKKIPWLAFGAHLNIRRLRAARQIGADKVVPKSQFDTGLREFLTEITEPPK